MRFSTEERRALGFIAGMVLLSVLGRWVDRPKPLDTDLQAVNLDSLEAAARAMRPARGARATHPKSPHPADPSNSETTSTRKPRQQADTSTRRPEPASKSAATTARRPGKSAVTPQPVFVPGSAITHIVSTEEAINAASMHGAIVPLNLNSATASQLEKLPRVGPVLAARIVAYRESVGRFENVDALTSVKGVGPAMLERLRPYLRVP